jgi:hypothetical protein
MEHDITFKAFLKEILEPINDGLYNKAMNK